MIFESHSQLVKCLALWVIGLVSRSLKASAFEEFGVRPENPASHRMGAFINGWIEAVGKTLWTTEIVVRVNKR